MQAMVLNQYGLDSIFSRAEVPTPSVGAGEVLIRVEASSVNTVDLKIREAGEALPFSPALPAILGMDVAGVVEAIGDGVDNFALGDEVYGCVGGLADLQGTLAEFVAADARLLAHKPKSLNMKQAAALPLVGITAYEGLQRAGIKPGQSVLVHGGTGGVGHVAVQLAKHWGAKVAATGSGQAKLGIIESYGAEAVNYRTENVADYVERLTNGAGFDLVFDSVGGENMLNSFEAATLNGNVATTVSMLEIDLTTAHIKGLSLHVVFMLLPMLHNQQRETHGKILAQLAELADVGTLVPLLDTEDYAFEQTGEAHARLASGQATGKVVIAGAKA